MWRSLLLVAAIWAGIYLPWLGTPELRSEEGHRVLPAVEMLDRGDYLIPQIGGVPYLRKPPLINWIVAGSFRLTGTRNEWTARFPSALAVLVVAVAFIATGRGSFGHRASTVAALAWLTSYGLIEKGRMIEIDAIYVSLEAVAFLFWLSYWHQRRSPWVTWMVPSLWLGLGMLAKGPAHLLYFYAVVVAILWPSKRLRDLLHPAHSLGLALMLGIFAAWAIPAFAAVSHASVSRTWWHELSMRITGGENDATDWPWNFPHGVGYFLPWVFLLPFIRVSRIAGEPRQTIARGLAWGALLPFVVVLLLPGTIPRYILPTIVPGALLLGMAVDERAFAWQLPISDRAVRISPRLIWALVFLTALAGAIVFPLRSRTVLSRHARVRPIAEHVNALVPQSATLYAVNPLFQPYLFYIKAPIHYLSQPENLPGDARFVITLPAERENVEASERWAPRHARLLYETPEYRGHSTLLFGVDPP